LEQKEVLYIIGAPIEEGKIQMERELFEVRAKQLALPSRAALVVAYEYPGLVEARAAHTRVHKRLRGGFLTGFADTGKALLFGASRSETYLKIKAILGKPNLAVVFGRDGSLRRVILM
jgi:hypothetical protein